MSEAKAFNVDETAAISAAKETLQRAVSAAKVYSVDLYSWEKDKFEPGPMLTAVENSYMVVAGGVIPSLLLKEQVNDIDVFILKKNISLFQRLVKYKHGKWIVRYFFDEDNDNRQEDYKNPHVFATATNMDTKVQYILTDHADRKSLLSDFDFLHATASYHEGKLYINRETYDAIMKKHLIRQHKNKAPKIWRTDKFVLRGWKSETDILIESPSKSLNDILKDNFKNLQKQSDDRWANSAKATGWHDKDINGRYLDAMQKALIKGQSNYSLDDELNELFDPNSPTK
jgi:hypothetical protein